MLYYVRKHLDVHKTTTTPLTTPRAKVAADKASMIFASAGFGNDRQPWGGGDAAYHPRVQWDTMLYYVILLYVLLCYHYNINSWVASQAK